MRPRISPRLVANPSRRAREIWRRVPRSTAEEKPGSWDFGVYRSARGEITGHRFFRAKTKGERGFCFVRRCGRPGASSTGEFVARSTSSCSCERQPGTPGPPVRASERTRERGRETLLRNPAERKSPGVYADCNCFIAGGAWLSRSARPSDSN